MAEESAPVHQESLEELRTAILWLDACLDAIPDAVLINDLEERLVRVNPTATRFFGYTQDERDLPLEERRQLGRLLSPEGVPMPPERLPAKRALSGQTVPAELARVHPPAGGVVWVSASAAPVRSHDGRLVGAISVFTDVTELREAQEQIEGVLRTVSHDLRTPLSVLHGRAQQLVRLVDRGAIASRYRGAIESLLVASRRMGVMLSELVEAVRAGSGRLQLDRQAVGLSGFLYGLMERAATALDVGRVRLEVEPDLPPVLADPDRLERIVLNLLTNALKYSPEHSPVLLRVREQNDRIFVSVEDRGVGIPPEDLPHVFDRYFRSRRTGGTEGIGLGLYITRALVEAHGGRIQAVSEPGEGSTFTFSLPTLPARTEQTAAPA